jgi:hypothetical protein
MNNSLAFPNEAESLLEIEPIILTNIRAADEY